MRKKIILTTLFSSILTLSSNAQKIQYNLCKILKKELKFYIDTVKISSSNKLLHNVYILTIFDNKSDKTIFGLTYISSIHNLDNISACNFATIGSDFVLIKTHEDPLSTASLIECLNANPISKNDIEKVKNRLWGEHKYIIREESATEYCIMRDGILKVNRSGW